MNQVMSGVVPARTAAARSGPVWEALVTDTGTGVALLGDDERVTFANTAMANLWLGDASTPMSGRFLSDMLPRERVLEDRRILARIAQTGRPALLLGLWRGRRLRTTIHPLAPDGEPSYLLVCRPVRPDEQIEQQIEEATGRFDIVLSEVRDLGPLAGLSRRQLEVLAMIGEGLSTQEMADRLGRSPKTIEKHRHAIATKLAIPNRVKLAQIAVNAGLTTCELPQPATST